MNSPQINYVKNVIKHIDLIIPSDKQHLYHLLMGSHILGSYKTEQEMHDAANSDFPYISCLKYCPIFNPRYMRHCIIKIQSCWRGYSVRSRYCRNSSK